MIALPPGVECLTVDREYVSHNIVSVYTDHIILSLHVKNNN